MRIYNTITITINSEFCDIKTAAAIKISFSQKCIAFLFVCFVLFYFTPRFVSFSRNIGWFFFSNLTGLPSSVVRYRGHKEKGSSIFTRNYELFCLLDKHYSPLLAKKWTILKNENLIFLHPLTKWRERRVTCKQLIGDINQCSLYDKFFLSTFLEKSVTIFSNFHFPLLP